MTVCLLIFDLVIHNLLREKLELNFVRVQDTHVKIAGENIEVRRIAREPMLTAKTPTTTYSTLFEFNDSTNSRKSLVSGIRVAAVPKFDNGLNTLLRT